jgi:hypothetical protein
MGSSPDSVAGGVGYEIALATTNVPPPNAIYMSLDDQLYLFVVPSVVCTLRVVYRLLLPTGELKIGEFDVTTVATRSPQAQVQNLGEGFLLSVNVYCLTQALRRGQVYVKFVFIRGGLTTTVLGQTICQGYVTEYTSLFYPYGPGGYELEGRGSIRSVTGTTPAAGAEIHETVPAGACWNLIAITCTLATSATVANRQPTLNLYDGSNRLWAVVPATIITASSSGTFDFVQGIPPQASVFGNTVFPIPNYVPMPAGYYFSTSTGGLQVADQWAAPQYLVEEWLQP